MQRLVDFHRRRYWLVNGWSIRFRVYEVPVSKARPHGLRYSFTLHDIDESRYEFHDADTLLCDFFKAVEWACEQEGVPFEFDAEAIELEIETEDDDEANIPK